MINIKVTLESLYSHEIFLTKELLKLEEELENQDDFENEESSLEQELRKETITTIKRQLNFVKNLKTVILK